MKIRVITTFLLMGMTSSALSQSMQRPIVIVDPEEERGTEWASERSSVASASIKGRDGRAITVSPNSPDMVYRNRERSEPDFMYGFRLSFTDVGTENVIAVVDSDDNWQVMAESDFTSSYEFERSVTANKLSDTVGETQTVGSTRLPKIEYRFQHINGRTFRLTGNCNGTSYAQVGTLDSYTVFIETEHSTLYSWNCTAKLFDKDYLFSYYKLHGAFAFGMGVPYELTRSNASGPHNSYPGGLDRLLNRSAACAYNGQFYTRKDTEAGLDGYSVSFNNQLAVCEQFIHAHHNLYDGVDYGITMDGSFVNGEAKSFPTSSYRSIPARQTSESGYRTLQELTNTSIPSSGGIPGSSVSGAAYINTLYSLPIRDRSGSAHLNLLSEAFFTYERDGERSNVWALYESPYYFGFSGGRSIFASDNQRLVVINADSGDILELPNRQAYPQSFADIVDHTGYFSMSLKSVNEFYYEIYEKG